MNLDPLLGAPFGSCYEVDQDGILYPAARDPIGEWQAAKPEDDHRSNANIVDNKDHSAQSLTHDDIAKLKRQGVTGESLVAKLCENSATFDSKTAFAQEKYVKKKMLKHLTRVRARQPTARAVCEAYFYKQPAVTNWMRYDALGMLLLFGNVGANAQPLVVETCGGLVVSAVAERVGAEGSSGRVCAGHTGKNCNSLDIAKLMNLSDAARTCVVMAALPDLIEARGRWILGEDVDAQALAEETKIYESKELAHTQKLAKMKQEGDADGDENTKKRKEGWRQKKIAAASPAVVADLARPTEGFSSLILASPCLDPFTTLAKCLPLLAPSSPFVVWFPASQPLAETLDLLRTKKMAVNLSLHEPWLRKHQVLPGRTHPTMTTGAGAGGYVLSGNWTPPDGPDGRKAVDKTVAKDAAMDADGKDAGGGAKRATDVSSADDEANKKAKP